MNVSFIFSTISPTLTSTQSSIFFHSSLPPLYVGYRWYIFVSLRPICSPLQTPSHRLLCHCSSKCYPISCVNHIFPGLLYFFCTKKIPLLPRKNLRILDVICMPFVDACFSRQNIDMSGVFPRLFPFLVNGHNPMEVQLLSYSLKNIDKSRIPWLMVLDAVWLDFKTSYFLERFVKFCPMRIKIVHYQ